MLGLAVGLFEEAKILLRQPPGGDQRRTVERDKHAVWPAQAARLAMVFGDAVETGEHEAEQLLRRGFGAGEESVDLGLAPCDQRVAVGHLLGIDLVALQPVGERDRRRPGQARGVLGHPGRDWQAVLQDLRHSLTPLPAGPDKI